MYLYDDKMAVLYNTQDSHSDVTIDDLSSSRVVLGIRNDIDAFYLKHVEYTISRPCQLERYNFLIKSLPQ